MKTVAIPSGEGESAVGTTPNPVTTIPPSRQPNPVTTIPPSRQGKKMISGHFDKDVHRQLKILAIERDTSIQNLLSEALNALFERNNKPPIA
ncbi:hypothetical protein J5I95_03870 [Candidatus Poribacteria bacterium]|nr:hypothetical protein [Candidatus Poribacteria bacterium]